MNVTRIEPAIKMAVHVKVSKQFPAHGQKIGWCADQKPHHHQDSQCRKERRKLVGEYCRNSNANSQSLMGAVRRSSNVPVRASSEISLMVRAGVQKSIINKRGPATIVGSRDCAKNGLLVTLRRLSANINPTTAKMINITMYARGLLK